MKVVDMIYKDLKGLNDQIQTFRETYASKAANRGALKELKSNMHFDAYDTLVNKPNITLGVVKACFAKL